MRTYYDYTGRYNKSSIMLVEEYKKYFPNYRFSEFKPYHAKLLAFIKKTMACLPSQEEKQKYAELISKRSPKT